MTYATTFSGVGGWELGLNASGWELKWQCENNEWCRRLLTERFGVPIYRDIRTICDESPPPVDALIGSPPCQPFSTAGQMLGVSDKRHLYPAFIKLVAQIQPRWVLVEQVPNILAVDGGRGFAGYVGGLAGIGYDVLWHRIPACAVGANHKRNRLWIIAHLNHFRCNLWRFKGEGIQREKQARHEIDSSLENAPHLDRSRQLQPKGRIQDKWGWSGDCAWWSNQPRVCGVVYGVPESVDRLKGLGNAVVPQIPYLIGQSINEIERLT